MLHIASSHLDSPRWVEIQLRALREHIAVPFTTWTSLPAGRAALGERFDHVIEQKGPLAGRLNHLAVEVAHAAAPEDLLMFLAPDAFPVADPMPAIEQALGRAPLLAARRPAAAGDPQPQHCFCVTTVGTWRSLRGDWTDGPPWTRADGRRVTDVGANLLHRLQASGTPWIPVERSDPARLDPVFFAVYGGIVYHHGGGALTAAHRAHGQQPAVVRRRPRLARLARERDRLTEWRLLRRMAGTSQRLYEQISAGGNGWLAELQR